jgi:hypothetical protein
MRRLVFRTESSKDALTLTQRLMELGLSVDRLPRVGHTIVKAVGDFDGPSSALTTDLSIEVTSDEED